MQIIAVLIGKEAFSVVCQRGRLGECGYTVCDLNLNNGVNQKQLRCAREGQVHMQDSEA